MASWFYIMGSKFKETAITKGTDYMENKEWVMPTHIIAAAGIVINDKDEVLMVKTYNAGWVFPGGQVEVGENVIDAVKREVMEEADRLIWHM